MALVLDTGVLYAALDETDPAHDACAELIGGTDEALVVPSPVLVEADYWLRKYAPAATWVSFCEDVHAGAYALYEPGAAGLLAAARLQERYEDLRLGFVDAAVFVTCETLGERKVATLDRKHFSVLRTSDGGALTLLPE